MITAVIPVRKGSQRVKNKSLRKFNKKNLLIYKIEKLKKLKNLDNIIVNTDSLEAIKIANGTKFGLVAGIWTNDGSRQLRMAKKIRAGQVFINNYGAGGGVELPFGGTGHSGYGREKGFEALNSFSTIKTIAINHG